MEQARIERRTTLGIDRGTAWQRVVEDFGGWFGPDATLEPEVGGHVVSGDRVGTVTQLDVGVSIGWEWSLDGDPGWTTVRIDLLPAQGGTEVVVTETLHAWEHETFGAIDGGGPGPFGVIARTR